MSGRYTEYLPSGYRLNIDDKSWWVERDRDDFDVYNLFAMSDDGMRWDIYIDYKGLGMLSRREKVDHVNSYSDDLREVTDLLDIWEELVDDRAYMVQRGLAASVKESVVIPDEYRGGNCFEEAWNNQCDDLDRELKDRLCLRICHGIATGYGPLSGTEFTHGWNEYYDEDMDGVYVIDTSNGNDIHMPAWEYYRVMGIIPESVHRYDSVDAYSWALQTGVYGPWAPELQWEYRDKSAGLVSKGGGFGDCFKVAAENAIAFADNDMLCCHGVAGKDSKPYLHAWNQLDWDVVIDQSNGFDREMPLEEYYDSMEIDESTVRVYCDVDVAYEIARTGHYGPWDESLMSSVSASRLAFDVPDENRNGNCFEVALRNVMDDNNLFVCHGVVRGQGALEGIEFPHAWNESSDGGYVLDESNGNAICMPRDAYYAMARLDPSTVRRYDSREAMEEAVRTGVYGPWEQDLMFDFREV